MKSLPSVAGWFFLAVILIVPSFIFYSWLAGNKKKAALERSSATGSQSVFPSREKDQMRPGGIISPVSGAPALRNDQAVAAPAPAAKPVGAAVPAPDASDTLQEPQYSAKSAAVAAMAPVVPAPAMSAAASTQTARSYFSPKSRRDPSISPLEYRQMKNEEEKLLEAERQRLADLKRRDRESGIENKINLQGIVGNSIIVNGNMYNLGQTVMGAKILKIGSYYFIGEYKGKQFKKILR